MRKRPLLLFVAGASSAALVLASLIVLHSWPTATKLAAVNGGSKTSSSGHAIAVASPSRTAAATPITSPGRLSVADGSAPLAQISIPSIGLANAPIYER